MASEDSARSGAPDRAGLRRRNGIALVICGGGCTQMIGYLTGSVALRGIGAATAASPLPKVFSDVDGLETFASEFVLRYRQSDGRLIETAITPKLYGGWLVPTIGGTSTVQLFHMRPGSHANYGNRCSAMGSVLRDLCEGNSISVQE